MKIVLRAWRDDPDLVRLLVREITRSPHIQDELDEIGQAFASLERIIVRGQEEGTFRAGHRRRSSPPGCSTARWRRC